MRSFIESFIDVGSGFILAVLIQLYIFPFFATEPAQETDKSEKLSPI